MSEELKSKSGLDSKTLESMIQEELDRPSLEDDIRRTLRSCDHMLNCFADWNQWKKVTGGQKRLINRALDGTIMHLEDSLSSIEIQIRNAANRRDNSSVQNWDVWRAKVKQKRNALREIFLRLQGSKLVKSTVN